jgi:hypothetical protein
VFLPSSSWVPSKSQWPLSRHRAVPGNGMWRQRGRDAQKKRGTHGTCEGGKSEARVRQRRETLPRLPSVKTAERNIDVGMGMAMGMGWKERTAGSPCPLPLARCSSCMASQRRVASPRTVKPDPLDQPSASALQTNRDGGRAGSWV